MVQDTTKVVINHE